MQHFIIRKGTNGSKNINIKDCLNILAKGYQVNELTLNDYKMYIFENTNHNFYNPTDRFFLDEEKEEFYYEKGYSKKYDEKLTFKTSDKIHLFDEDLENVDGTFAQIFIKNNNLKLRTNHMVSFPLFYSEVEEDIYITSNPYLLETVVSVEKNEDFEPFRLCDFKVYTFVSPFKKIELINPTTIFRISDGKLNKEFVDLNIKLKRSITVQEAAKRLADLYNDLLEISNVQEIFLELTGGKDVRVAAALVEQNLRYPRKNIKAYSEGNYEHLDRKIGKVISNMLGIQNKDMLDETLEFDTLYPSKNIHKRYKNGQRNYYLSPYSVLKTDKDFHEVKVRSKLHITGLFGNIVHAGIRAPIKGRDTFINFAFGDISVAHLNEKTRISMHKHVKERISGDYPEKQTYTKNDFVALKLRYHKHNMNPSTIDWEEGLAFSPFANDIFLNLYIQKTMVDLNGSLHLKVAELISYRVTNLVPYEDTKGGEKVSAIKFLPSSGTVRQMNFYAQNYNLLSKFFKDNEQYLEKYYDSKITIPREMRSLGYHKFVNAIGYLYEKYDIKLDDDFYKRLSDFELGTEADYQSKFIDEIKFINFQSNIEIRDKLKFYLINDSLAQEGVTLDITVNRRSDIVEFNVDKIDMYKFKIESSPFNIPGKYNIIFSYKKDNKILLNQYKTIYVHEKNIKALEEIIVKAYKNEIHIVNPLLKNIEYTVYDENKNELITGKTNSKVEYSNFSCPNDVYIIKLQIETEMGLKTHILARKNYQLLS